MKTLVDLLIAQRNAIPNQRYTFLEDGETLETHLTFSQLDARARAIAVHLLQLDVPKARALLLFPPGLDFIAAFFGCLYAGVIAVPTYPPDPMRLDRTLPRLQAIASDARASIVLTTEMICGLAGMLFTQAPELEKLHWVAVDALDNSLGRTWEPPNITSEDLAFLQYTSGSTGQPKGVMVSHRNLLHNSSELFRASYQGPETVGVSWLPSYHDMGLIGGILQPLYAGMHVVLMSPLSFLQKPARWLWAISRYRGVLSPFPNFALDLCVRKVTEAQCVDLDLRSWYLGWNGAEPVRVTSIDQFAAKFERYGFRRETMFPCYGLAEGTLIVSGDFARLPNMSVTLDRRELERDRVIEVDTASPNAHILVGAGRSIEGQTILIVDPATRQRVADNHVGEIWVQGPSVARGYWNRPEETAEAFQAFVADTNDGPYLRTGDLGFLRLGTLFVTGRLKDLIILRGRNHYPQDIELMAEQGDARIRKGCCVAFSIDIDGEERLLIVAEVDERLGPVPVDEIARAVRQTLADKLELSVHGVVLLKAGGIPKTSSGKLQRRACRARLQEETLEELGRSFLHYGGNLEFDEHPSDVAGWLQQQGSQVLRIPAHQVDMHAPLPALGLDSLMAVELRQRIEQKLGRTLQMALMTSGHSLFDLAKLLEEGQTYSNELPPLPALQRAQVTARTFPLSQGQRGLWHIHSLAPQSAAYHVAFAARFRSLINVPALADAVQGLSRRHPLLRCLIIREHGEPRHEVLEHGPALQINDASALGETELRTAVDRAYRMPFDPAKGPLFRASLFHRTNDDAVLLLVAHHLVCDGWSLWLLLDELRQAYEATTARTPLALPEPAIHYADYVAWEAQWLGGAHGERLWTYWRNQLAGAPDVLALPIDHPRPAQMIYRGASVVFRLNAECTERIRALARSENVTLYVVLLAAFELLLGRYTGQDDFLVGTAAFGREFAGLENIVGHFVNVLPIRADLAGDPTIHEFLARVRKTVGEALTYQAFPLPQLIERLNPQRSPDRPALVQAVFSLQAAQNHRSLVELFTEFGPEKPAAWGGTTVEPFPLAQQEGQFDLTLEMAESRGQLVGQFKYNADIFKRSTIERLVGHFEQLVHDIVADPGRRITELDLVSPDERRLLSTWSHVPHAREAFRPAHALFEASAQRFPDTLALADATTQLTYRELNAKANQMAHALQAAGVGPDSIVALCTERQHALVMGQLAIWKAGGAFLPIDPASPRERVAFMLREARVSLLLTQSSLQETLRDFGVAMVFLDAPDEAMEAYSTNAVDVDLHPDNLAYVIYTSGSTGRPKGVLVPHRGLATLADSVIQRFGVRPDDRVLQFAPMIFDVSVWEQLMAFSAGASLWIAPADAVIDPGELGRLLERHRMTVATLPPAVLSAMPTMQLPDLRVVISAADFPSRDVFERWSVGRNLWNAYGPTEISICATVASCSATSDTTVIGGPIGPAYLYVVDKSMQWTPVGVPGELCIGGEGVARGYLGNAALTAERFVPDPFGPIPGARLYRSGDLCRRLDDGTLQCLGRLDEQVKIRGFRIEPGEVAARLRQYPGVREAVVVAVASAADGHSAKRLVAYLVPEEKCELSSQTLLVHLRDKLPAYMLPASFVFLERLPLTSSGKVDRRALPRPETFFAGDDAPPRTQVETLLAAIWSELLGVERIGTNDDFFALGGHSLLATRVIARIHAALGVDLPLRTVFEAPNLASLAARIDAARNNGTLVPPIVPRNLSADMSPPLSSAQQRLFFLEQLQPGSSEYILVEPLRLLGPLDVSLLESALNAVVARHETLRATFATIDGTPRQQIAPAVFIELPLVDLSEVPPAKRDAEALRLVHEIAVRPFELDRGPLVRALLVRLDNFDHVWVVAMHHIVADGWSLGIFREELVAYYDAAKTGTPLSLPALPIQYADYAVWRDTDARSFESRDLEYWKKQFAAAVAPLNLPLDGTFASTDHAGAMHTLRLSPELTGALRAFGQQHRVTLFMVLLAALNTLLFRLTGQADIVVGVPIMHRDRMETERLIGLFLDTLAMRTRLTGTQAFHELLDQVRNVVLSAETHRHLPFDQLIAAIQPERDLNRHPLFDVMLNVVDLPFRQTLAPRGTTAQPFDRPEIAAKCALELYAWKDGDQLALTLLYRRALFSSTRVAALLDQMEVLLEQLVAMPNLPLHRFTLVTPNARQVLPDPQMSLDAEPGERISDRIQRLAQTQPEHAAVCQDNRTWSYRALADAATNLAHNLRTHGLQPGDVVAVTGPRCFGLIAAMTAVLFGPGVLLTLAPDLPLARHELMLREAGARLLLHVGAGDLDELGGDLSLQVFRIETDTGVAHAPAQTHPTVLLDKPRPARDLDDAAYVFFTSGTTGTPRAVLGSHRGLNHFLHWQRQTFAINADDRAAQLTGLSFDVVLRDVFTPLTSGATLCLPMENDMREPSRLLAWLERERITLIHTVPTIARVWLDEVPPGVSLPWLRRVFFAGEPLADTLVHRWRRAFPTGQVVNLYGPTETTLAKCYEVVEPNPRPGIQPVGRPMPGAQSFVFVNGDQPAGIGETGEIVLRTPFRSHGYLNDAEETSRRFIPNPWNSSADDLLYRTGDLGRFFPDGRLEILGRLDHQVKIAGVRVEPAEVAAALERHAHVSAACVVAAKNPQHTYALVAYVVPAASTSPAELLNHLSRHLPAPMLPAAFVFLEQLPVSPNGKVDRKALPPPVWDVPVDNARFEAQTPAEQAITELWSVALGVERVGLHDNFFLLGGHSLLAMQVAARMEKLLGVDIPVRAIFETPTIADLLARLSTSDEANPNASTTLEIVPAPHDHDKPFPLTDVQAAFWLGRRGDFAIGDVATQGYQELDLEGYDIDRLLEAFQKLIQRHDMLRVIILPNGTQRVLTDVPTLAVPIADLRHLDASTVDDRLSLIRNEMTQKNRKLDQWPLFDVHLSHLNDGRVRLHIVCDAIISDVWSTQIALRDLIHLYRHPDKPLPPLEITFRDYVLADIASRESAGWQRSRAYWLARVQDLPPAPELPLAIDPSTLGAAHFKRRHVHLDAADWLALKRRAARYGVTPASVLLTAYAAVLAAWSRSSRFTLNITVFHRPAQHPHIGDIVGNFSSLVLLAVDMTGPATFESLVSRVQTQLWRDLEHARFSGVQVLRELSRKNGGQTNVLMPMVFTSALGMPGFREIPGLSSAFGLTQSSQVFINHGAYETQDGLELRWDAVEAIFPQGLLDAMFGAYAHLVRNLAGDDSSWTNTCTVLPDTHRQRIETTNSTDAPVPSGLLHSAFEQLARLQPDAPAVITPHRTVRYDELLRRATQLSLRLEGLGVRPGDRVAVIAEKGWEQIAAVLGILRSGAAYVPMDPSLPERRLHTLLTNAGAHYVLTQTSVDSRVRLPEGVERILVDIEAPFTGPIPDDDCPAKPTDPAYIIYTSGTTGTPKGVVIDHRGALNTVVDINTRFGVTANDRVLGLSSLSFDLSVWDIFGTLAAGAALVLPDASGARDPEHWIDLMQEHHVSVWNSVPALMEMFVDVAPHAGVIAAKQLRLVLLSGDWIPVTLPNRLRALNPSVEIISLGGATEASIWSIYYPIGLVDPVWRSIPYGFPLLNQQMHVFDDALRPRPMLAIGELYIGGIGVAMGYWDDPRRTAERFIQHPTLGRLYRTGDMGRRLSDGSIEFLGREDAQVKIRGYRIELEEIEAVLLTHSAVRAAVAAVRRDVSGERRIFAWIVPHVGKSAPEPAALHEHLTQRLPAYMIPAGFGVLESLPLSSNGKVDRQRLPSIDVANASPCTSPTLGQTPAQSTLVNLWKEILRLDEMHIDDDFFALGGDSILAIQFISRAKSAGFSFSARHLFQHRTVRELAALTQAIAPRPAPPDVVTGDVPLTPVQHWFFAQSFVDPHHWNQALRLVLRRSVGEEQLRRALGDLFQRHDALRLRFVRETSQWRQFYAESLPELPLDRVDLSAIAPDQREAAILRICDGRQSSLDLQNNLARFTLIDRGPDEPAQLLVILHHLIVDGISWRVLLEELEMLLESMTLGIPPQLPPTTTSFQQWSERLKTFAQSDSSLRATLPYWLSLAQRPVARLPVDHAHGDNTVASASTVICALSRAETQSLLGKTPQRLGTRINDILLGALLIAVSEWTNSTSLLLTLESHGREDIFDGVDISRTVGWFTSIFPVWLERPDGDVGVILQSVHAQLERLAHRGFGFGLLRYLAGDESVQQQLEALPRPEISFDYLGQFDQLLERSQWFEWEEQSAGPTRSPRSHRRDVLEVIGAVGNGQLRFTWTFGTQLHERATIERVANRFVGALREVLAHAEFTSMASASQSTSAPSTSD